MTMMWPLPTEGKPLDMSVRLTELTGFVAAAARDGLPAHELERGLWSRLLQLGHDLQAQYFAWVGDGDCGKTLTLVDGRVVKRLPEPHGRPYQSISGDFRLERVVCRTRESQQIEAAPLDARLGLPEGKFSYFLQDWDQALVVENPYSQLWDAAAETLGDAPRVEILDLLHATGYLWEAVHLFHGPGSEMALKWMKLLVCGLLSGMGAGVIRWLQHLADQGGLPAAARTRLAQIHADFDRHRDRIHYDQYLAAGSPIASGVIEGACRHGVKDRMERARMHWALPGAQALLNLRCVALNVALQPRHRFRAAGARWHRLQAPCSTAYGVGA